jgi:hypothetical protein
MGPRRQQMRLWLSDYCAILIPQSHLIIKRSFYQHYINTNGTRSQKCLAANSDSKFIA